MPVFSIENFKYGLDDRRNQLSMASGSLNKLVNGHITTGGEIEKRLAFNKIALPTGCFGLEVTDKGLTTFGDQYRTVGTALGQIDSEGYLVTLTPRVFYQRLVHPNQYYIESYENASLLSAVLSSTNYAGKAWVVAKFGTDTVPGGAPGTFCYYDGVPVLQNFVGKVMPGLNLSSNQAEFLTFETNKIVELGWINGFEAYSPSTPWLAAESFLGSPVNVTYVPTLSIDSSTGAIKPASYGTVASVPAEGAHFSFSFTGTGTCKIRIDVCDSDDNLIVTLYNQQSLSASKDGHGTSGWASFIAATINKTPLTWTGSDDNEFFQATFVNDAINNIGYIQIKAPAGFTSSDQYRITGTSDLTIAPAALVPGLFDVDADASVEIAPASMTTITDYHGWNGTRTNLSDNVKAVVINAGASPTFAWTFVSGSTDVVLATAANLQTVSFKCALAKDQRREAVWKVTVTRSEDSAEVSATIAVAFGTT